MRRLTQLSAVLLTIATVLWWIRGTRMSNPSDGNVAHPIAPRYQPGTRQTRAPDVTLPVASKTKSAAGATAGYRSPALRALLFGENGPVTIGDVPAGRFRDELLALPLAARERALNALGQLRIPLNNVASLHVDHEGMLYFACARTPEDGRETTSGLHRADTAFPDAGAGDTARAAAVFDVAVPISTPPVRHSRPGSPRVIYLDFNGHTVTGTAWNSAANAPVAYVCTPYDIDGNPTSFNPAEQSSIVQIWDRVAEAYRMFDVDVTTEEPAAFTSQTARVLITKDRDVNGVLNPDSLVASGVAYLDVFGTAGYPTVSNVVFVYYQTLSEGTIAAVAAHEVGHNLGLSHDGTSTVEYYSGHGSGETSWGPIMGNGRRNVFQWSKGEYFNANNPQDDLAIIAARLNTRSDDHAGTDASATPLTTNGPTVQQRGSIETTGDGDTFTFSTAGGPASLRITPNPNELTTNKVALDVVAELRDAAGALVVRSDPADVTSATIDATLPAGTFFLRVSGTGVGTPLANPPSGYTSYGSVGSYVITGTLVPAAATIPAAIVQQPEDQAQFPGNSAVFSTVARGNPATTFAWQRSTDNGATWTSLADDGTFFGSATATLTVSKLTLAANGERYRCIVTNAAGSATSTVAALTVTTPPPPTLPAFGPFPIVGNFGRGIPAGTSQNLTVSVTAGSDPITYKWQLDGVDVRDGDGPTYFLRTWQTAQSGIYRVVATNAAGSVTSPGYTQFVSPEGGWQWRNPLPTGNGLSRASFLNGQFLVGGLRGTLLTSADGINWTVRTVPAANNLFSFHYFNGLYIALGSLGAVFTSPDAVSWTPRNSGTVHRDSGSGLQDMALGDGRLVAVGLGGLTSTSTDGINWTPGTAGTTEDLSGVIFGFDRFHAVSLNSGRIYSSADGVTWTSLSTPSSGLRRIAFGAGRLVAVGNTGEVQTSTNGLNWTAGSAGTAESFLGINFVNGQFIAVGTGGAIRTSPDGVTWTGRASGGNRSQLQNATFGNGVYVIPGQSGTSGRTLLVSNDGVTWRETVTGAGGVGITLRGVTAGANGLVAVGSLGTILQSTNGTRWVNRTSGTFAQLNDVAFGGGLHVAVGNNGAILTSPDGTSWSTQPAPANVAINGIRYDNGLWVAAAAGRIFTSATGNGWLQRFTNGALTLNKSAFGNGVFVTVGTSGTIVTSTDGTNWTAGTTPTRESLNGVTFANGLFVTVGGGGVVLTSTNGTTWTDRSFSNDALTSVNFAFGQFVATGSGSSYYYSPDGSKWSARFTGSFDAVLDAAVLDNELHFVGENSSILAAGAPVVGAPGAQVQLVGTPVALIAPVSGSAFPLTYQWTKDGIPIPGATSTTLVVARAAEGDSGDYRLVASGLQGTTTGGTSLVTVAPPVPGRIVNLSVRASVGAGGQTLITGFFVSPGATKTVLIRGVGPGLTTLGVSGALADPQLQLFSSQSAAPLAVNDNWGGGPLVAQFASVGAFPLDAASRDAALQQVLTSGGYTAQVSGVAGTGGVALVELYDTEATSTAAPSRLTNVSARAQVGSAGNLLIAGFSISGNVPRTVLVRGIGPGLTAFGVTSALADPQLELYQGTNLLYANDNWGSTASAAGVADLTSTFALVGAFALPNPASRDAALLLTLPPGSYTAQISGVNGTTGVALVEVYEVP